MAWLDQQTFSSDSSGSKQLHEMRRAARTTPRVNRLLEGTSAHVNYGLASGGYVVQQSGRPTSMPHYTAPRQFDHLYTPSGYVNLEATLRSPPPRNSSTPSPWSYNNVISRMAPRQIGQTRRSDIKLDRGVMAGDELQINQPSNDHIDSRTNQPMVF
jgi:hypothetical protein